jgi:hypothetical protein
MDNLILVSAQGSQYNLGTWLDPALGVDYGEQGVLSAMYADNPAADRIQLGYVDAHPRTMKFPMILASSGAFGGLHWLQTQIRQAVNSNPAYLDVLLDGVATGNHIRFDILTGRLVSNHDIFMQSQLRRDRFTLELDTQPFGYMPTLITLASVPTAFSGSSIVVPGASVLGDVKSPARILWLGPNPLTNGTAYSPGTWFNDVLAWGFNTQASFKLNAEVGTWTLSTGSYAADPFAPAASAWQGVGMPAAPSVWNVLAEYTPVTTLNRSYYGRFHAFGFARLAGSGPPVQLLLDTALRSPNAMASGNPVATLAPEQASGGVGWNGLTVAASPAYQLLDLGEVSYPPGASALPSLNNAKFRLWCMSASWPAGATPLRFGGVYLIPLDQGGANLGGGVLPRGLAQPSIIGPSVYVVHNFMLDGVGQSALHMGTIDTIALLESPYYRGPMPYVDQTVKTLEWITAGRKNTGTGATSATGPSAVYSEGGQPYLVSVQYQPRFLFVKGGV